MTMLMLNTSKYSIFIISICLLLASCSFPRIYVYLVNQSSTSVQIGYSHAGLMIQKRPVCYDTIRFEIKASEGKRIGIPAINCKRTIEGLSKQIPFIIFETPAKSVCLEGPEEVVKVFNKRAGPKYEYEYIITDSLFNNKQ